MAQYISPGNIFGRIGSGIGKGLAESMPDEIQRQRLGAHLKSLSEQKDLTPFQQFSGLVSAPGSTPQIVQSGTDLLRQQAILNNAKAEQPLPRKEGAQNVNVNFPRIPAAENQPSSVTPPPRAKLQPYLPPEFQEREQAALDLHKSNPLQFSTLDSARNYVNSNVNANIERSNAEIAAEDLRQGVQTKAEKELKNEIDTRGASIPGEFRSEIEKDMLEEVNSGKISEKDAAKKYGQIASDLDRVYKNIYSWGGVDLITNNKPELLRAMDSARQQFEKIGKPRRYAESLMAYNEVTPGFAYAQAIPVNKTPELNNIIKELKPLETPHAKKVVGLPGLGGVGSSSATSQKKRQESEKIYPQLAKAMGKDGSPQAIAYELDKKGYDGPGYLEYVNNNADRYDLTTGQLDELGKTNKSYFGILNNWWLQSFSGVK